jgi:hypothetical protein
MRDLNLGCAWYLTKWLESLPEKETHSLLWKLIYVLLSFYKYYWWHFLTYSTRIGDRLVWVVRSSDLTHWATRALHNHYEMSIKLNMWENVTNNTCKKIIKHILVFIIENVFPSQEVILTIFWKINWCNRVLRTLQKLFTDGFFCKSRMKSHNDRSQ